MRKLAKYLFGYFGDKVDLLYKKYANRHLVQKLPNMTYLFSIYKNFFFNLIAILKSRISSEKEYRKKILVYDLNVSLIDRRIKYLKLFRKGDYLGYKPYWTVFNSLSEKLSYFLRFFILSFACLFISILMVWHRDFMELIRGTYLSYINSKNIEFLMRNTGIKEIYLFQIYYFETNLISSYLKSKGFVTNLVATYQTEIKWMVGTTLAYTSKYQEEELEDYLDSMNRIDVEKVKYWGPERSVDLVMYKKKKAEIKNVIGVYTSGIWTRDKMVWGNHDVYYHDLKKERIFLEIEARLAKKHPDWRFINFLHPVEKRNKENAKEFFDGFFKGINNVEIRYDDDSNFHFNDVGLGVTIVSTIGFDRIESGFRTLFFNLKPSFNNPKNHYNLYDIFCESESDFVNKIKYWNDKTNEYFMKHFHVQPFYERLKLFN